MILLLLASKKTNDSRYQALQQFIELGGFVDDDGNAIKNDFVLGYVTEEDCYTPSGVVSPTKWKKFGIIPNLSQYDAVIPLDTYSTALFTKDRFFTAVKGKYSYKQKAVFPTMLVQSMEQEHFASFVERVAQVHAFTKMGEIPQPKLTEVVIVDTAEQLIEVENRCIETGLCVFDVETNEIDDPKNRVRYFMDGFKITTLSISPIAGIAYVMSIEHKDKSWNYAAAISMLNRIFTNPKIIKVAHNLKYDLNALSSYGLTTWKGQFRDTMLMAHLVNEAESAGLARLTEMYLPTFHGYKIKNFNIPFEELAPYNAQDTDNTCRLFYFLEGKLREDGRKYALYRSVVMPTFWQLFKAERRGADINEKLLDASIEECKELLTQKRQELLSFAEVNNYAQHEGKVLEDINFNSPKQLAGILFTEQGFNIVAYEEETGERTASTRREILAAIDHPFVDVLLEYRTLEKLLGTFFVGIKEKLNKGKLHADFKLHGTKTGRASCVTLDTKILVKRPRQDCDLIEFRDTALEEICVGDLVPAMQGVIDIGQQWIYVRTHTGACHLITHAMNQGEKEVYEVKFKSGQSLQCTADHKFLVKDCTNPCYTHTWKELLNITSIEYVIVYNEDGTFGESRIDSLTYVGRKVVADIRVDVDHSYIANGVVVHNCSDPNLQQLPSRTSVKGVEDMVLRVKKLFNAPFGKKVLQADFSQLELRLIAMFSRDPNMIKAYEEGKDLHCLTASQINNMSYGDFMAMEQADPKWYKRQRACGKGANFSLSYGCSSETYRLYLKTTYGTVITKKEAELHHKNYFKQFPSMLEWHETYKAKGRQFGFVRTFFGRTRLVPDIKSINNTYRAKDERVALNCVSDDTEILTTNGWLTVNDLVEGQELFSINPITGELELDSCQAVNKHVVIDEPMIEIENDAISVISTLNHRWLVDRKKRGGVTTKFETSSQLSPYGDSRIWLSANHSNFKGTGAWTDKEIELIGWALTDGYYPKPKNKEGKLFDSTAIRITQSKPQYLAELKELMAHFKCKNTQYVEWSKCYVWGLKGETCRRIRETLPDRELTMPFLLSLSTSQLNLLYQTMLKGDGSYDKEAGRFRVMATFSKNRTDMFTALCVMIGKSCGNYTRDYTKYSGQKEYASMQNKPKLGICDMVTLKQRNRAYANIGKSETKYSGIVWCPTTKNSTWIARRNGRVYCTGNSPVQGSGGELAFFLISLAAQILPPKLYEFILTVHDSLLYYVEDGKEQFIGSVLQELTANLDRHFNYLECDKSRWTVPLALDVEAGDSYGNLTKL